MKTVSLLKSEKTKDKAVHKSVGISGSWVKRQSAFTQNNDALDALFPSILCKNCSYFNNVDELTNAVSCPICNEDVVPFDVLIPKAYITDFVPKSFTDYNTPYYGYSPLVWEKGNAEFDNVPDTNIQMVYLGNGELIKSLNQEIKRDETVLRNITTRLPEETKFA